MMIESMTRCVVIVAGLITTVVFCIMSWASWDEFKEKEEAHHHVPFMNILISLIVSLALLNWRLGLATVNMLIEVARGSSPLSLGISALIVTMIIFWILFSNNWEKNKEKEKFTEASWQFTYIGSIVLPILCAALIFGIAKTGGKIC